MIREEELFAMRDLASKMAYSSDPFDRVAAGEVLIKLIDEYRALRAPEPVSLYLNESYNRRCIRTLEGSEVGMTLDELLSLPEEEMEALNSLNRRGKLRDLIAFGKAYRLAHPLSSSDEIPPKTLDGEV